MVITAARFEELKADRTLISCREEEAAFEAMLTAEVCKERASRSAETRRRKKLASEGRCPECGEFVGDYGCVNLGCDECWK